MVTGDAYVDHPSFGAAVIGRVLESRGFRVGIIAQPDFKDPAAFKTLGRPRLAFLVSSGNLDSMVANYTVNRKPRREDWYTPGNQTGRRPDRAVIAYTSMIKGAWKGVPVIIGGLEASLRRMSHYDYWSDKLRRPILQDSKADLLIYGMGETAVSEIAGRLDSGVPVKEIKDVSGTVCFAKEEDLPGGCIKLPDYDALRSSPREFGDSFKIQYQNTDPFQASALAEPINGGRYILQNPPAMPLNREALDAVYDLPFTRSWHPDYEKDGGISALKEVQFSLTSSRGCFGGCSFCSITFHQGKLISARSHESILREAGRMIQHPDFKGIIHDVGGPTANFRRGSCEKQEKRGSCQDRECLGNQSCKALKPDHSDYLALLRELRALKGVKRVFIRSGIRYDYLLKDTDELFFRELVTHHVSGQLKVAPEHVSDKVLKVMNKPPIALYEKFRNRFFELTREIGKKQFVIPYLISSHPGAGLKEAVEMALWLKKSGFIPDQVQDFYPTPGTLSTAIYYCGFHPVTGEQIYTARNERDKKRQRALLHFHKPENRKLVLEALREAGRQDLIGEGRNCLIKGNPRSPERSAQSRRRRR